VLMGEHSILILAGDPAALKNGKARQGKTEDNSKLIF